MRRLREGTIVVVVAPPEEEGRRRSSSSPVVILCSRRGRPRLPAAAADVSISNVQLALQQREQEGEEPARRMRHAVRRCQRDRTDGGELFGGER